MAALKAAVAFMLETDQQNRSSFAELMPQMLEVQLFYVLIMQGLYRNISALINKRLMVILRA
jgi:hypothetical protein